MTTKTGSIFEIIISLSIKNTTVQKGLSPLFQLSLCTLGYLYATSNTALAQVTSDGTVNTQVNLNGNVAEITGGETRGSNLFHSFQDFSVGTGNEAFFNNADNISNILSRVTGGNASNIDGVISTTGTANLFLINPAGIIFGEDASLNVGGSFIGTSADSLLFPDGIEYSATDIQSPPILTINAPIGLNFRDNPGDIINRSFVTDDSFEDLIGLRVFEDQTLALIGGDVLIEGGFVSTIGGRIELGSVAENSTVSITPVEKGFDFGYEEVANFQDISLSFAALVNNLDANPGDIELQGRNISLIEGSQIGISAEFEGQAGDVNIIASESLTLDGNGAEVDLGEFPTIIFSNSFDDSTGNQINIEAPQLTLINGGQIGSTQSGSRASSPVDSTSSLDIEINASEIILEGAFFFDGFISSNSSISAQVFEEGTASGGNLIINTGKLTINEGAQINASTFGSGNAGNITINASESIELNGTSPDSNTPSCLFAAVEIPLFPIPFSGNGGDITINSPRLVVSDGAEISTAARNNGNGGNLNLNVSESILLTGTSPLAEFRGEGISGIFVSVEPSFEEFILDFDTGEETLTGEIIPTTGKGGNLTLNTGSLIIEQGALISANTFSLGDGGNADINVNQLILRDGGQISAGSLLGVDALDTERGSGGSLAINTTESIDITGIGDINGVPVNSSLFTLAESTGDGGNLTISTGNLSISNGADINASSSGSGNGGLLDIQTNSLSLDNGSILADVVSGSGGNTSLSIENNLTLRNNSLISASAFGDSDGGNVDIDAEFIIAFPSQVPNDGNDIIAIAEEGFGGNVSIFAEAVFGMAIRLALQGNGTNDISSVTTSGVLDLTPQFPPTLQNVPQIFSPEQTTAQACQANREIAAKNGLNITGKGGIPAEPGLPLDSQNVSINGETNPTSAIPAPIETSQGKIQPARGIKVTESGEIILTAYRTNNSGERIPEIKPNCS